MAERNLRAHKIGWIGTGRMGLSMAARLLKNGCDVAVYNRTRAKAEPLAALGARIVDSPAALAERDVVFTIVAGNEDLVEVVAGPAGLLSRAGRAPKILIDCTTVSQEASAKVRAAAAAAGCAMLAAPISGNPKVVKAGRLSVVVSGARAAYDEAVPYLESLGEGVSYVGEGELARIVKVCHNVFLGVVVSGARAAYDEAVPYLESLGEGVSYVGEGELARIVKVCHNVFLGVVTQSLAEITVLAEKAGVPRHALLDFINKSVMGSTFTKYKTPAFVNLDFAPTFTPVLLRKDLDLGLAAARKLDVPMPVAAVVREIVQSLIGNGYVDCDFAALLALEAKAARLALQPENVPVSDGLDSEAQQPAGQIGVA